MKAPGLGFSTMMLFALFLSMVAMVASREVAAERGSAKQQLTLTKRQDFDATVADAPEAIWHEQFSVQFNETTRIFVTKHTSGTWYYDAVTQKEAIYRENGNGDRYCGSVHPFTQTPCAHIVTDGKRYLVFPELGECCMCCTAERGCGILSPSWLQGASFEGTTETQGIPAYKWRRDGLQPNYWYASADEAQVPLQLDQLPNDLQTFWPSTFTDAAPPPDVFDLPEGCKARCPLTSVCTVATEQQQQQQEEEEQEVDIALLAQ